MTLRVPANACSIEDTIRKSRFIAYIKRVTSLAETLTFYESVADPGATHNCWAWRLGHQYRFNDDGEPGGTAGKPILASIDGKSLDQTMVVVTRYYGGTKLGVGGLIRAYGGTAARCIDASGIEKIEPRVTCRVSAPFEWTGQIHATLSAMDARKVNENFNESGLEIDVIVLQADYERLKSMLRDATRGDAAVRQLEK